MNLITIFNPKGGTGKTTAVMALASGYIEAGDRVAVLDVSEPDRHADGARPPLCQNAA